jgi:hypothetical protein
MPCHTAHTLHFSACSGPSGNNSTGEVMMSTATVLFLGSSPVHLRTTWEASPASVSLKWPEEAHSPLTLFLTLRSTPGMSFLGTDLQGVHWTVSFTPPQISIASGAASVRGSGGMSYLCYSARVYLVAFNLDSLIYTTDIQKAALWHPWEN